MGTAWQWLWPSAGAVLSVVSAPAPPDDTAHLGHRPDLFFQPIQSGQQDFSQGTRQALWGGRHEMHLPLPLHNPSGLLKGMKQFFYKEGISSCSLRNVLLKFWREGHPRRGPVPPAVLHPLPAVVARSSAPAIPTHSSGPPSFSSGKSVPPGSDSLVSRSAYSRLVRCHRPGRKKRTAAASVVTGSWTSRARTRRTYPRTR
jgi:hypothetical protein